LNIDKDEFYREFDYFKLQRQSKEKATTNNQLNKNFDNSFSTSKYGDKISNHNQYLMNIKRQQQSRYNLIPSRSSEKIRKNELSKSSYNNTVNGNTNNPLRKSREKIYYNMNDKYSVNNDKLDISTSSQSNRFQQQKPKYKKNKPQLNIDVYDLYKICVSSITKGGNSIEGEDKAFTLNDIILSTGNKAGGNSLQNVTKFQETPIKELEKNNENNNEQKKNEEKCI
jgi:hypothetical protein